MSSQACDIVIFGALGDLTQRKLIPALFQLARAGLLHEHSRIVGVARNEQDSTAFIQTCLASLQRFVAADYRSDSELDAFAKRLSYVQVDFKQPEQYQPLAQQLESGSQERVFYFATAASLFGLVSEHLHNAGCLNGQSRVVLEKPLGHDTESSNRINEYVGRYFEERQIFRIDHYLGKETVQNLLALRFANPLFGNQWSCKNISHIEITVAEKVGIEGRWGYFDEAGQMRDMVQNHLLQLLCLTAMDPPLNLSANAIRNEKVKVLQALSPVIASGPNREVVRGRYVDGQIDDKPVPGYLNEPGANQDSCTETFVAIKAEIRNWRWAGVPFYLRTGKRMKKKLSQITVHFKPPSHYIFDEEQRNQAHNRLTIRLQPDEGISLQILNQDQDLGHDNGLKAGSLRLDFAHDFGNRRIPDAYERLLLEVIRDNQNLFVRRDEIEYAWQWVDQLQAQWANDSTPPQPYPAGSWGPKGADLLTMKNGHCWHEDLPAG
ncbi:glucose-6-phosphate dehydrogenase [Oceanobacter mangrovi]|uniref:glucose-6-phosphate dehydrogenase n=1 Tax=Oceanobacter mangrovi TaxID=2862510 RepID=UPI001C8D15D3|nr:glucose-6-phosphate dehydrogenase [Oceanobacter mangrovi]